MIPQTIHYCWFGGKPLPEPATKCIRSWRKFLPNYEIKEWNESNFDVCSIPYTKGAYEAGKYAFVSDYARFWILYHHGGIYFDTDVEVIKQMDDIVAKGAFMGIEKLNRITHDVEHASMVNPGLGMGAEAGHIIYKELLDFYGKQYWLSEKGKIPSETVVYHATRVLCKYGLIQNNVQQCVEGINIYPSDYFCPMDGSTGLMEISSNTVSIHWYSWTWLERFSVRYALHKTKKMLIRILGERIVMYMVKYIRYIMRYK